MTTMAKEAQTDKTKVIKPLNKLNNTFRRVGYKIRGHIEARSEGRLIRGKKIKIYLKQGRQTIFTQTKTLDSEGSCSYEF